MTFSERVGRLAAKTAQAEDSAIPSVTVEEHPWLDSESGRTVPFPDGLTILIGPEASDDTIIHEFLHVIHPDWPEAMVEERCLQLTTY